MDGGPAVRLVGATVRYGSRLALHDVTLDVPAGTTLAVVGPNGAGKSTLLGAIAGLVPLASGEVHVDRSRLAVVLQSTAVDRSLPISAAEVVRMGRYRARGPFGRLRADDHDAVARAMERTAVGDLARRQLHELSGGQRQRVLVAQGLAQEADVLVLDEPITGLDVVSRRVVLDVVEEERAAGRAVVVTTHSLEDAALCDAVALVVGRLVAHGPPAAVLTDRHLEATFGGRLLRLPDGRALLDDPHHHHDGPGHHHHDDP